MGICKSKSCKNTSFQIWRFEKNSATRLTLRVGAARVWYLDNGIILMDHNFCSPLINRNSWKNLKLFKNLVSSHKTDRLFVYYLWYILFKTIILISNADQNYILKTFSKSLCIIKELGCWHYTKYLLNFAIPSFWSFFQECWNIDEDYTFLYQCGGKANNRTM